MQYSCCWKLPLKGDVAKVDISPSGDFVFTGAADGLVQMISKNGNILWEQVVSSGVLDVRCSQGAQYSAAVTEEGETVVFDAYGERVWREGIQFNASTLDIRDQTGMMMLGNRYRQLRQVAISGKIIGRGEVKHNIDFIKFAPAGKLCAVASADGHVTMLNYKCQPLWHSYLHRMIIGIDIADSASLILCPSFNKGIVSLNTSGEGVGVYEMRDPIVSAEINDAGDRIVAADNSGWLIHMEVEGSVLSRQQCGFNVEKIAMDGDGSTLAVLGSKGPGETVVARYNLSAETEDRLEFIELSSKNESEITERDVATDYLEIG